MAQAITVDFRKTHLLLLLFSLPALALGVFTNFHTSFLLLLTLTVVFTILIKPVFGFYLLLLTLIEEQVQLFVMVPPFVTTKFYLHLMFLLPAFLGFIMARSAGLIGERPRSSLDTLIIMVVIYETISLLWSPSIEISLLTLIILYCNFLLYFIPGALVRDERVLRNCVNIWILAGVIVGFGLLLTNDNFINIGDTTLITEDIGIQHTFRWHNGRASGFAGSDSAAGFLVLASAFAMGSMIIAKEGKKKLMYFMVVVFMFYCNIVSTTRSTMFGNALLFLMFMFLDESHRRKLIKYFLITVFVGLTLLLLAKPGMIDRTLIGFGLTDKPIFFEKEIFREETLENVSGIGIRMIWWKEALAIMLNDPLRLFLGLGLSGFLYHTTSPAVNGFVWAFFFDMGIFGCILLMLLFINLYLTFKPYLRNVNYSQMRYPSMILLCAILGYLADMGTHGLVDYDLTGPGSRLVWFPLGFIICVLNIVKRKPPQ